MHVCGIEIAATAAVVFLFMLDLIGLHVNTGIARPRVNLPFQQFNTRSSG